MRRVVVDTTTLIALARIGKFNLLQHIFGNIIIPEQVYNEVVIQGKGRPGEKEVKSANWIEVRKVKHSRKVQLFGQYGMGPGESEVIILAAELGTKTVITDDNLAAQTAESLGFNVIQTVEILILAKTNGLISSVKEAMDNLRKNGFWLGDDVYADALAKAGEK